MEVTNTIKMKTIAVIYLSNKFSVFLLADILTDIKHGPTKMGAKGSCSCSQIEGSSILSQTSWHVLAKVKFFPLLASSFIFSNRIWM